MARDDLNATRAAALGILCLLGAVTLAYGVAAIAARSSHRPPPASRSPVSRPRTSPGSTARSAAPKRFSDPLTGFSITKPDGWHMLTGSALSERAQEEAQRPGNPDFGAPPGGAPDTPLVRITRYAPGEAPGPNPTIVATRFDLQRLPPGTAEADLLRVGVASFHVESATTTLVLGGRTWQKLTATTELSPTDGLSVEAVQEVYVTADNAWAIGVVIAATREQYEEHRAAFDAILSSVHFSRAAQATGD